jgi:hypothetical protein
MRKAFLYTALLIGCIITAHTKANAQFVNIPDTIFRAYLTLNYPQCMSGTMLDTTCSAIMSATYLNISNRHIANVTGVQYFDSLTRFNCGHNDITALPNFQESLKFIECGDNAIAALPPLPAGLDSLYCERNLFGQLPALPQSLKKLVCYDDMLTSLPALPSSLYYLKCGQNPLTQLPALPASLTYLETDNCELTSLPALPAGLLQLRCRLNNLTSLPALPAGLTYLGCNFNQLTGLPALPPALKTLEAHHNEFFQVPPFPQGITDIAIGYNNLAAVPALPEGLLNFEISGNPMEKIPALPSTLLQLSCDSMSVTQLPQFPPHLRTLFCSYTNVQELPALPDSMISVVIRNNPYLHCLPRIGKITVTLWFTGTPITCVPNHGYVPNSEPLIDTFPLCDPFNPGNCNVYWNISGSVFNNDNNDCVKDTGEAHITNMKLLLYNNGVLDQQVISNQGGHYSFDVDDNYGNYTLTLDTVNFPTSVACPAVGYHSSAITSADSLDMDKNFAVDCDGPDASIGAVWDSGPCARPGNTVFITARAGNLANEYNLNCPGTGPGRVTIAVWGPGSYVGMAPGALTPTTVYHLPGCDSLIWDVPEVDSLKVTDFKLREYLDSFIPSGTVFVNAHISLLQSEPYLLNNHGHHCFNIINSYDPNNKQNYPPANISPDEKWITYTLNFQNTGNAPALHVYLLDTLSNYFDLSSFRLLGSSHTNMTQILSGGIAKFTFANINLPDSNSNEPASHGFVQYTIKLKDNLPLGTVINNTGYIYFDFNAPVVTNTTVNTIALPDGLPAQLSNLAFAIMPNPAHGSVTVQLQNITPNTTLKVFDVLGAVVKQQNVQQVTTTIDISTLQSGVYFVQVETANGRGVKRLIVQ